MYLRKIINQLLYFLKTYKITFIVVITIILSGILTITLIHKNKSIPSITYNNLEVVDCNRLLYATVPVMSQRKLNDDNDTQLLHAQANGLEKIYITNQAFIADSTMLLNQNKLVRLKNNPLYHLKNLTHSYPYVTPEMAQLLSDIGLMFRQKLREKDKDHYRILITSALRTTETQHNLLIRNRNAHSQSTHLYGATVDVTYKEFYNTKTDKTEQNIYPTEALRETMLDFREQCRLVAVREWRQGCYHFTVVNCDPAKIPQDSISYVPLYLY